MEKEELPTPKGPPTVLVPPIPSLRPPSSAGRAGGKAEEAKDRWSRFASPPSESRMPRPTAAAASTSEAGGHSKKTRLVHSGAWSRFSSLAQLSTYLQALVAIWIAARTLVVAHVAYIPVPFLGYFRYDISVLMLLSAYCLKRLCNVFGRAGHICSLIVLCLLGILPLTIYVGQTFFDPPLPLSRNNFKTFPSRSIFTRLQDQKVFQESLTEKWRGKPEAANASAQVLEHASIDAESVEKIRKAAMELRDCWTRHSGPGPLGYFTFGGNRNFESDDEPSEDWPPFWHPWLGFRRDLATLDLFTLGSAGSEFRDKRDEARQSMAWAYDLLRQSAAEHLGVPPSSIRCAVLDNVDDADLHPPGIQINLPNVFNHLFFNPHFDHKMYARQSIEGKKCNPDSLEAIIWPITAPFGAGLLYWDDQEHPGELSEYRADYVIGNLYSFPSTTLHSIAPWPYLEWDSTARMTFQAFFMECGDTLYMYH